MLMIISILFTNMVFCSTRWVQSTFTSLCPLTFNKHRRKSQQHQVEFLRSRESNLGLLGETQEFDHCAMQPPSVFLFVQQSRRLLGSKFCPFKLLINRFNDKVDILLYSILMSIFVVILLCDQKCKTCVLFGV